MNRFYSFSLVIISLSLVARAGAQTVPGPMQGEMLAFGFAPAGSLRNLTLFSFSSRSLYDDNLSNSAVRHHSGEQQYLTATLGLQQTRRYFRWALSYRPGVTVGAQTLRGNQFSQVFGGSFELQPSVRWSLKLRQDYAVTIDPFERLGEAPLQASLGPLERPNELTVLPQLRRTAGFSGADLSYRLSRHTTLGMAGSYAVQRYRDYTSHGAEPLVNNSSATGQAYLSRQFSRRYTAGFEYRALTLTFPGYDMRALTHSILSFHQFDITAHSSVVLYAGPEYSRARGEMFLMRTAPAASDAWSPAAGAVLTWTTTHNRLQAGYGVVSAMAVAYRALCA